MSIEVLHPELRPSPTLLIYDAFLNLGSLEGNRMHPV